MADSVEDDPQATSLLSLSCSASSPLVSLLLPDNHYGFKHYIFMDQGWGCQKTDSYSENKYLPRNPNHFYYRPQLGPSTWHATVHIGQPEEILAPEIAAMQDLLGSVTLSPHHSTFKKKKKTF